MAGLYDRWKDPSGKVVTSFTIITTQANQKMSDIHDRMPVILAREDEGLWLDPIPIELMELKRLFRPFPSERMEIYPVSRLVNDLTKDSEELIKPLSPSKSQAWF
jgi:putative SOS response-associated peptidase YedK